MSQKLGEGDGFATGKLGELEAAGKAVGQYQSVRTCDDCWQQVVLGHLQRNLVMAFLHSEVASQAAASADCSQGGSGRGQQGCVSLPTQY